MKHALEAPVTTSSLIDRHYGFGAIMATIEAGLRSAGRDLDALAVDDLAPIDEFHTRGRESTLELASLAEVKPTDTVIDVGCGLGGTARYLAQQVGCHVTGLDLTDEYVVVGRKLTEMVGLGDRVTLVRGDALEMPFGDKSFDVAWTEHAQMNIADKQRFYAEIARVLKPGGRLLFHDIFRGDGPDLAYPVPWAERAEISALATEQEARQAMEQAGLAIEQWHGKVDESLAFFTRVAATIAENGPPPIGIHLLMGDNASVKLANYVTNLTERRTTVAMGVARKGS